MKMRESQPNRNRRAAAFRLIDQALIVARRPCLRKKRRPDAGRRDRTLPARSRLSRPWRGRSRERSLATATGVGAMSKQPPMTRLRNTGPTCWPSVTIKITPMPTLAPATVDETGKANGSSRQNAAVSRKQGPNFRPDRQGRSRRRQSSPTGAAPGSAGRDSIVPILRYADL